MSRSEVKVVLFSPELPERTYPGRPPIYYLSSALRRAGISVETIDVDIAGRKKFSELIRTLNPRIVAGTALSIQMDNAVELFQIAKAISPSVVNIIGGNHVTASPDMVFPQHANYIDGIVVGEGLSAIVHVANVVSRGAWQGEKSTVPGLMFWESGKVYQACPGLPENPDSYQPELPYAPEYNFSIFKHGDGTQRRTFQMSTAFGCLNACFFCYSSVNKRGESRRTEKRMSIDVVDAVLKKAVTIGYEAVYFDDDTFTRVRDHALEVSSRCKHHGLVFGCHTRPDTEDEELIERLVRNGCVYMFSGLESVVPEILIGANKTGDPVAYRDAYERSYDIKNRIGLPTSAFLIHGMPRRVSNSSVAANAGLSETQHSKFRWEEDLLADSYASIEFAVKRLDPAYLSMNVLRLLPGVAFAESSHFAFLRPVPGRLHGGHFDSEWLRSNGMKDPRCYHPILRAFEGSGSPVPPHMTPARCYQILSYAVEVINNKNRGKCRNQTRIVVDPWFRENFLQERSVGGRLQYELARSSDIERVAVDRDGKLGRAGVRDDENLIGDSRAA